VLPDRIARIAPKTPVACTDGCLTDAQCDDGDACTNDRCLPSASLCRHEATGGTCTSTTTTTTLPPDGGCASEGRAQAACLCAAPVAECATTSLPRGIGRRHDKACSLVALDVTGKRERRTLQRAASLFERAAKSAGKRRVDPSCGGPMATRLRNLAGIARAILDGVRSAK
jgi:hypothetical protein